MEAFSNILNQNRVESSPWNRIDREGFLKTKGTYSRLPSTMELYLLNYKTSEPVKSKLLIDQAPINFSFHLSGTGYTHIKNATNCKNKVSCSSGQSFVSYLPNTESEIELIPEEEYRIFNIYVTKEWLFQILSGDMDSIPKELHKAIEGKNKLHHLQKLAMTPQVHLTLTQLYNCPFKGELAKKYIECKCIELMLLQMAQESSIPNKRVLRLCPKDIDCIHHAHHILLRNLPNPPSLPELAKQAGINTTKLKKGFNEVFGCTVCSLLRKERVDIGRKMLLEGHHNITEISHELGYSDASHFIREFSKYYGMTPGQFSRESGA